jgi:hypothetical protein
VPIASTTGDAFMSRGLTPVEEAVDLDALGPAEEDVGIGLHQSLTLHHPFAGIVVVRAWQAGLEHRSGGLLDLQEEWVVGVSIFHQHDPGPGADAADAENHRPARGLAQND